MAAAERNIRFVSTNLYLGAVPQHLPVFILAHHHGGLLAAMADRAKLSHLIGQGEQCRRAGEKLAAKIHPQSVAHHWYVQIIDGAGKLPHLFSAGELSLVEEDTGTRALGKARVDPREKIISRQKRISRGRQADPRGDLALACAIEGILRL